ncbi:unnamed protein product, partial [marine sediment metagenome]
GTFIRTDEYMKSRPTSVGDDFDSIYEWIHASKRDFEYVSTYIGDGQNIYHASRSKNGQWEQGSYPLPQPDDNPTLHGDLSDLGWPDVVGYVALLGNAFIDDDEYANENNLICFEDLSQGRITDKGKVYLPSRLRYYINPQRDYICQQFKWVNQLDAPWQKDKSWLEGIDPEKIPDEHTDLTEVTEFIQTDSGQWYPRTVESRRIIHHPDGSSTTEREETKTVYVETDREFPEGIFDAEKITD